MQQSGEESCELYEKERDSVLGSLKRRAVIMVDALNKLDGISCQPTEGARPACHRVPPPFVLSVWKPSLLAPCCCMDLVHLGEYNRVWPGLLWEAD